MSGIASLKAHLAKSSHKESLATLKEVEEFLARCYPALKAERVILESKKWVIVSCAKYCELAWANIGPLRPTRMVFSEDGTYSLDVVFTSVENGSWVESNSPHTTITNLLDTLLGLSGYVVCPGIRSYEEHFAEFVRFESKNLRIGRYPVRHDSVQCLLWHKPHNVLLQPTSPLFDLCVSCKTLYHDLSAIKKRALAASPQHKEKHCEASSRRPLKYLSPASQSRKLQNKTNQTTKLKKALKSYESSSYDVGLSNEQDMELQQLVGAIGQNGQSDLETIFREAEDSGEGCGDTLREHWERDVTQRKQFFEDQLKNKSTSRGNRWSIVTFRIALAIYTRSTTAYEALRGFGILQLPSISTLKKFTGFNLEKEGFSEERLVHARQQYDKMVDEKRVAGGVLPFSEGYSFLMR